ncbi:hypothetical protein [Yinghuangia soli]|uniref:Uncharacterized protein n=1 Tax=Yinghuangia soli TaxID=2908204 RepID=A0AA41Q5R9_9ACTN|nr:hypothetical protein [Yinghuangia soli]MCF2532069.1 hypothetical protein [Yinghuangia soli]
MTTTHAVRRVAAALAVAAFGAGTVALSGVAVAAPGDNGTVKIHATTTPFDDNRDEPKVCRFYLAAFQFDTVQEVTWSIDPQPAKKGAGHLDGQLTLVNGTGHTGPLSLPNGMYKLTWNFEGQKGNAKQKVFKVSCAPGNITSTGGGTGGGGNGGAPTVKDVFGNTVPAGGSDLGGGGGAGGINPLQAGAGIAVAGVAVLIAVPLLRRGRRGSGN